MIGFFRRFGARSFGSRCLTWGSKHGTRFRQQGAAWLEAVIVCALVLTFGVALQGFGGALAQSFACIGDSVRNLSANESVRTKPCGDGQTVGDRGLGAPATDRGQPTPTGQHGPRNAQRGMARAIAGTVLGASTHRTEGRMAASTRTSVPGALAEQNAAVAAGSEGSRSMGGSAPGAELEHLGRDDIQRQWPERSEEFIRAARGEHRLSGGQLFEIWFQALDDRYDSARHREDEIRRARLKADAVGFVDELDRLRQGAPDAVDEEYRRAAAELATTESLRGVAVHVLDFLETVVDSGGDHLRLDQVDREAANIASGRDLFGYVGYAALGIRTSGVGTPRAAWSSAEPRPNAPPLPAVGASPPPRAFPLREAVDTVAASLDDAQIGHGRVKAFGVATHADGVVTVALSGSPQSVQSAQSRMVLPPNYRHGPVEARREGFTRPPADGDGNQYPGNSATCVEPRLCEGARAHGSPVVEWTEYPIWRGDPAKNPYPRGDGTTMNPCPSCDHNATKMQIR